MGQRPNPNHQKCSEEEYRRATQILVESSVEIALYNNQGRLLLFGKKEPRAVHPCEHWIGGKRKMLGESDRDTACRIMEEKYGIKIKYPDKIRYVDCYSFVRTRRGEDGETIIVRHKESKIMRYHLEEDEYQQIKEVVASGKNGYNQIIEMFPGEMRFDQNLHPSLQCLAIDLIISQIRDKFVSKKRLSEHDQKEYGECVNQAHTLTGLGDERIFYTQDPV